MSRNAASTPQKQPAANVARSAPGGPSPGNGGASCRALGPFELVELFCRRLKSIWSSSLSSVRPRYRRGKESAPHRPPFFNDASPPAAPPPPPAPHATP